MPRGIAKTHREKQKKEKSIIKEEIPVLSEYIRYRLIAGCKKSEVDLYDRIFSSFLVLIAEFCNGIS